MIFKSDESTGELNGFLDSGSRMEGDLHFDNSFRIDGKFDGKVHSDGNLIVGEGGEVEGEIEVGQIFISGNVRGTIRAKRQVHLAPGGRVFADLETPSLIIEDRAIFHGHCTMARQVKGTGGDETKPQLVQRLPAEGGKSA